MMKNSIKMLGALLIGSALSACYVVPAGNARVVASANGTPATTTASSSHTLNARLYPSNAEAQRFGGVHGTVTVDQAGHGRLNAVIGGESFSGDATRDLNSRRGTGNASAPSGRYISCDYTMHSATLGKGECKMSTGAIFEMHISK
ncbi:hypothetical protein [Wielerella bovis]|uniref:hypothetical protein n=1 Tax=Wielerella bovis TaxID=2917790 RepID=UPI002019FE99|nr:hypothetical protein [Wielerella bovis]ULJ67099.1 hypothetical protein MIS31_00420 [Wielerella bovis]